MPVKSIVKEEGVITMCVCNGLFIIGRLLGGGKKLLQPRVFTVFTEKAMVDGDLQEVEKIGMRPLPGTPPFCYLGDAITYPVVTNQMNILDLYHRVTTPLPAKEVPEKPLPYPFQRSSDAEIPEIPVRKSVRDPDPKLN